MIKSNPRPHNLSASFIEDTHKEQIKLVEVELNRLNLQREVLDRRQRYLEQQTADSRILKKERAEIGLHQVLRSLPYPATHFDNEQRLLFCNNSASELLGVAGSRPIGKRIWELMNPLLY